MEKNLFIDASHPSGTRVVLTSLGNIEDYEYESKKNTLVKNNIYLGKVSRVEPSLQAAFLDFGRERHGFLAFNDIQPDYYQIPQNDIEDLKQKEEELRIKLKEESKKLGENDSYSLNHDGEVNNQNNVSELDNVNTNENVIKELPIELNVENFNDSNQNKKNIPQKDNEIIGVEKNIKTSRQSFGSRRYKIQEVIKPNQIILVQVLKDERGKKGAALTTFIS